MALLGGGGINLPTLVQRIVLDHSGVDANAVSGKMGSIATSTTKVGASLTKGVTLPLVGAGVAAVAFAGQFDDAMAQSVALAGVAQKDIKGLSDQVLELSGETARAPKELAEAFYFVASAGFSGAEAMDVLDASAKASAAGLGETQVIADGVTSAINAYGKENLSASEATDVLVKAVQFGKLEADELAPVLGRLVPITSAMGVEFDEAAALLAVFSKTGVDAAEGVTAFRGILSQLASPTKQARELLAGVNLTVEDLRATLKDKGVLALLLQLKDSFGGNIEQLSIMFPEIRGLVGLLNALGQDAGAVADIFDEVKNSTGATDEAFKVMSETAGFKTKQAMADLQRALIDIGAVLLPIATAIIGFGSDIANAFIDLPGPVKLLVIAFGGLLAVAGPALILIGKITQALIILGETKAGAAVADAAKSMLSLASTSGPAAIAVLAVAAAVAIGAGAWFVWSQKKKESEERTKEFRDAILADTEAMEGNTEAVWENLEALLKKKITDDGQVDDLARISEELDNGKTAFETFREAVSGNERSAKQFRQAMVDSGEAVIDFGDSVNVTEERQKALAEAWVASGGDVRKLAEEMGFTVQEVNALEIGNRGLMNQLQDSTTGFIDGTAAAKDYAQAGLDTATESTKAGIPEQAAMEAELAGVAEQALGSTSAFDEMGNSIDPLTGKTTELVDELKAFKLALDDVLGITINTEEAAIAYEEAMRDLNKTVFENGNTLELGTEKGEANRTAMIDSTKAALTLAEAFVEQSGDAESANAVLAGHAERLVETATNAGLSEEAAIQYAASLLGIPPERATTITSTAALAMVAVDEHNKRLAEIPREKNTNITATVKDVNTTGADASLKVWADKVRVLSNVEIGQIVGPNFRIGPNGQIFPRQHGGRVTPGMPYQVGEAGPELFMPGTTGTILPAQRLKELQGGGATVGGNTYVTNVYPAQAQIDEAYLDRLLRRREHMLGLTR